MATVRGVLRREGVGGSGGEDNVVGFDRIVPEDVDCRAVDARNRATHDLAAAQEIRVGHEDCMLPHRIDSGAQGRCVVDELVLLFDENDVREGIKSLSDRDASVSSANDCDACHVFPPYEWTASIVSPDGHERAC